MHVESPQSYSEKPKIISRSVEIRLSGRSPTPPPHQQPRRHATWLPGPPAGSRPLLSSTNSLFRPHPAPYNSSRRQAVVTAALDPSGPRLAIAGITGAVGQEFLRVLSERNFPYSSLKLLASARSAGKTQDFEGVTYTIEELKADSFGDCDIALFSAGGGPSKAFIPAANAAGCYVVDNSSAFRMTDGVPLVVPEINGDVVKKDLKWQWKDRSKAGCIANPNCSTIIALMAVTPLHRAANVRRMVVSTYQAASGAGQAAMDELRQQTIEACQNRGGTLDTVTTRDIFPWGYAFNLFSHNAPMTANGYNEEEMKMVKETAKIWGTPAPGTAGAVGVAATCIRVPVMRAHAESINLELEKPLSETEARALLEAFPGVTVLDDRSNNRFPMPSDASFQDDVYVGRVRADVSRAGTPFEGRALELFVVGDQIKKGAALNAVQCAELLL